VEGRRNVNHKHVTAEINVIEMFFYVSGCARLQIGWAWFFGLIKVFYRNVKNVVGVK